MAETHAQARAPPGRDQEISWRGHGYESLKEEVSQRSTCITELVELAGNSLSGTSPKSTFWNLLHSHYVELAGNLPSRVVEKNVHEVFQDRNEEAEFLSTAMSLQHFLLTKLCIKPAGKEKKKNKGLRCTFTKQAKRVNVKWTSNKLVIDVAITTNSFPPLLILSPSKMFCSMSRMGINQGNDQILQYR